MLLHNYPNEFKDLVVCNIYNLHKLICYGMIYSSCEMGVCQVPSVKYIIELSDTDRKTLTDIVTKGSAPAKTILRANILLASDRNNKKHMTVAEIAENYHTTPTTVQNVRTSYANNGLEATITRKKRETPPVPPKVTGEVEAHIIALACGDPPEGYEKWTLRLLADKCVELNYAESLSHMTVSRVLKKTNLNLT